MATEVILLKESLRDSLIRDAATYGGMIGSIYIGVWLDSQVLQWLAALMLIISVIGRAAAMAKQNRFTLPEARKRLDEIEAAERT